MSISSVREYPLVGALPHVLFDPPGALERLARAQPGKVVPFQLGPVKVYLVSHPDHVQSVLSDSWRSFGKGAMWKPLRLLFGDGLAAAEGDIWLRSRRMLQPLFTQKYMATLTDLMTTVIGREIAKLERLSATGKPFDMVTLMMKVSQSVLFESFFGTDVNHAEAEVIGEAVDTAFEIISARIFLYFIPAFVPLPGDRKLKSAIARIDEAMFRQVNRRRSSGEVRNDLLSLLLNARDDETGAELDQRQLRDELVTLFVAGNDTTAMVTAWMWYMLDQHPEVASKVRGEIDAVFGGRAPTFAGLGNLHYTKMVIQETLRLYPTAWFLPRFSDKEETVGDCRIPAGSSVIVCPYVTHRDPALWPRPQVFDPTRFTGDQAGARHRYAYFPFGGGPRACIGLHFANLAMQLITVLMVQNYRPRLVPGTVVKPHVATTLRPRNLQMILERVVSRSERSGDSASQ